MSSAQPGGLPVYDHRSGVGPTLVFLHYWGGSSRTWQAVVDRLPGRDVVTMDLRGWSRSRDLPGPYTLEQLADDTLGVLAKENVEDHVLVGHSMGGKVAQLVAARRPPGLRGVVLVAPGPAKPAAAITPEYQDGLSHAYDSDESVADVRDHVLTATELTKEVKAQVVLDSRSGSDVARPEWPLHGIAEDITPQTRLIEAPSLVVAGEYDKVEPVEVLRANLVPYLSNSDLMVLSGTGHLSPLEAPDELANVIAGFVDAH
jgi:pimeloyl-ACP methyl ester carboxylesterase